jgi:uncharacterized membrane protein YdbT with pleckstrin-like domain
MSYVTRVLQPGEQVVYTTRLHWLIYFPAILLAAVAIALAYAASRLDGRGAVALQIVAGIFALMALWSALHAVIRRMTTELAITDHRVIYKVGLLSRHTLEMNRAKVESVDVDQTLLGRLLGYGTVVVRGTGGSLEPMRDVTDPLGFRSHITAA